MKEIYLDNASTTRVSSSVIELISKVLGEDYGNPSSLHRKGMDAEKYIKEAKEIISNKLNVNEGEVYFTSCGTESNNTAILGTYKGYKREGNHYITTRIEHPSVLESFRFLEDEGAKVDYLNVDSKGYVDLDELENLITEDTVLVSIMHINNEIGTIQDLEKIGNIIKNKNKDTLFHVDGVQSYGKYDIDARKSKIDMLSISGHKIHAPKGIGALYVKKGLKVRPLLIGGHQQNDFRSGTENVPYIAALGLATKEMEIGREDIKKVKEYFVSKVEAEIKDSYLIGEDVEKSAYHVADMVFKGVRSEVLLHALESDGIYVSSGSACSSNKPSMSGVLKAIGIDAKDIDSSLRFSFSKYNSTEDMDYVVEKLKKHIDMFRKIMR
ncbi:MAG: cysteine desulfurase [Clostridia bacterium]|nr:cysteine desulfurase [Clostridia bacterium]